MYLASQYGSGPGGGVLLALNASSGAVLWRFNTVAGPEPGVQSLGLGAGGAWETPLVGERRIGDVWDRQSVSDARLRRSRTRRAMLYTDSDVNLDAATGKLRWYYQGVPDDFKDYDMQASPISAQVGGVPVVIGSGKMGYVYEMNADHRQADLEDAGGRAQRPRQRLAPGARAHSTLKVPFTILPGSFGGVLTDLAVAGNSVYVATIDLPLTYTTLNLPVATKAAGPRPARWRPSTSRPARWNGTGSCRSSRSAPPRSPTISCSRRCTTVCWSH